MDLKLFEKTFISDKTEEVRGFYIEKDIKIWKLDTDSKNYPEKKFSIIFKNEDKEVFFENEIELLEYKVNDKTIRQYIFEMEDYNVGGLFGDDKEFPDWEEE